MNLELYHLLYLICLDLYRRYVPEFLRNFVKLVAEDSGFCIFCLLYWDDLPRYYHRRVKSDIVVKYLVFYYVF